MNNTAEQVVKTKWLVKEQGEDARWVGEGEEPQHSHDQFMAILARAAVVDTENGEQTIYMEVGRGYTDYPQLEVPRKENPTEVLVETVSNDFFDQSVLALRPNH